MSQPPYGPSAKDDIQEKATSYPKVLYSGQMFEVRPSHCKCPAPEIVPIGRPALGSQALPAFPHGTMLEDVLRWGGRPVKSTHSYVRAKKQRSEITRVSNQAQELQQQVVSFRQYQFSIAQDVSTAPYRNARAQIHQFQYFERQLREQLERIQKAGRTLREKFRKLEEDAEIHVSFCPMQSLTVTSCLTLGLQNDAELTSLLYEARRCVDIACLATEKA